MNEFQKFLCVLDRHEKTDFLLKQIFCSGHFFDPSNHDQKMTRAKKFVKVKNQLFHACQPCKGIFEIRSC